MSSIEKRKHKGIEYWIKGKNPKLLIHSGTHGNEAGVIEHVKEYVVKNDLPDFVYVPEVSPSAVKSKTRENCRGVDLNRSFKKGTTEPEAVANMEIAQMFDFDSYLSFHEDVELCNFYVYDTISCHSMGYEPAFMDMREELIGLGYSDLNGLDEPSKPEIALTFDRGYKLFHKDTLDEDHGSFEEWGIPNNIFKRGINPEVPAMIQPVQKKEMVGVMFKYLLNV